MNFAQQTQLLKATEYFNRKMEKVYVRQNCRIRPFSEYAYNPNGGSCYYLSCWALMGLDPEDCLFRGQIDLPKRPGWKAHPNYKHGWVQFYYEDDCYIYDPCESTVWEQNYWEETFNPHDVTFIMSQREILKLILENPAYDDVYQINQYIYQFKDPQDMDLQYNCERDGFLRDTLGGSQIHYSDGRVSYFLAENRRK